MDKLTNENYYSQEMNREYMSVSQFKDFLKCEAFALAKLNGEWEEEKTTALLVGSYVDSYFSGELDQFKQDHPELLKKDGTLKSDYIQAEELIKEIENDPMFYAYYMGNHQVIYTGEISGVPFKIKIDSDFNDKIVDGKVMKDTKPIWVEDKYGRNVKQSFIKAYGYDLQGAVYQEIKRQRVGVKMPFILAPITKEKVPGKYLINVEQETLDNALKVVKELAPHFQDIKVGLIKPTYCGKCDYCRSMLKVNKIVSSNDFEPYDYSQEEE